MLLIQLKRETGSFKNRIPKQDEVMTLDDFNIRIRNKIISEVSLIQFSATQRINHKQHFLLLTTQINLRINVRTLHSAYTGTKHFIVLRTK